jgi:hypothetical protein
VGEEKLAADCCTSVRSVRRAKAAGFKAGILICTERGNRGTNGQPGRASRHVFNVKLQDTSSERQDTCSSNVDERQDTCDNREDTCGKRQATGGLLNTEIYPEIKSEILVPSSSCDSDGHSSSVTLSEDPPEKSKGSSERGKGADVSGGQGRNSEILARRFLAHHYDESYAEIWRGENPRRRGVCRADGGARYL